MKKTAVDWLAKNLKDFPHIKHSQSFKELIKQAKEIEKEIIRTAYLDGMDGEYNTSEQYYNETFKSE